MSPTIPIEEPVQVEADTTQKITEMIPTAVESFVPAEPSIGPIFSESHSQVVRQKEHEGTPLTKSEAMTTVVADTFQSEKGVQRTKRNQDEGSHHENKKVVSKELTNTPRSFLSSEAPIKGLEDGSKDKNKKAAIDAAVSVVRELFTQEKGSKTVPEQQVPAMKLKSSIVQRDQEPQQPGIQKKIEPNSKPAQREQKAVAHVHEIKPEADTKRERSTNTTEYVVRVPSTGELFVRAQRKDNNTGIQMLQKENRIILSAQKQKAEQTNTPIASADPVPITTITDLEKTMDVVNSVTNSLQVAKESGKEIPLMNNKQPVSEVVVVVSDKMLELITTLTKKSDSSSEKQPGDKKIDRGVEIIFATQGDNKRKFVLDQRQAAEIRELLFVSHVDSNKLIDESSSDSLRQDHVSTELRDIIQAATIQGEEKNSEPILFVSKDIINFLDNEKATIEKLEMINRIMKKRKRERKETRLKQSVILSCKGREITMELEILKKLLLVQQMRKQRQSTGSNYQDEQAPQEMKSKVLPGQSGSNTSSLSSLTMPFILALIKGHREVYSRQTLTTI